MDNFTIYTNNPKVQERFPQQSAFYTASAREVLTAARNAIHKGAAIVKLPVPGGVKPMMNPFISIILTDENETKSLDLASVRKVEEIMAFHKKNGLIQYRSYNDQILDDLQALDLSFLVTILTALQSDTHN